MITIWQVITIQGLYCYLDMGNNPVMYYKINAVMSRTWYAKDVPNFVMSSSIMLLLIVQLTDENKFMSDIIYY